MSQRRVNKAITESTKSRRLDLSECELDQVPERVLYESPHLNELRLDDNAIAKLPDAISNLQDLHHFSVANNAIRQLPSSLTKLTGLKVLGLSSNQLSSLPTSIGRLRSLNVLSVEGNNLHELPESLGLLEQLTFIDASANSLTDLPLSIGGLRKLEWIFMWGNAFSEVPFALRRLSHLKYLDLSSYGAISRSQTELVEQTHDPALEDQFSKHRRSVDLVRGLAGLQSPGHITGLINEIPGWLPEKLAQLEFLALGDNSISKVPENVGSMKRLRGLYLRGNVITELPMSIGELSHLEELDLAGNMLTTIPYEIQSLPKLRYLDLRDNPIGLPPEILARPHEPDAIFAYLNKLNLGSKRRLSEAKVLVVGQGSVGKTSLVRRLRGEGFSESESKTEGIDIHSADVGTHDGRVALNFWDFGGQEIMHATHQFFLTKRSVYVLVIDARQSDEQNRIEYWLKLIQGYSGASPVILVGNKSDQSRLDIDKRGLRRKYPNVAAILETSCRDDIGIKDVWQAISGVVSHLPHVQDLLPESYFRVKEKIEALEASFLPYTDYEALCTDEGIVAAREQEALVAFLHDLGTVLCFRDDPRLSETNILNPEWVTGGVYRLLNSYDAAQKQGLLAHKDVHRILDTDDYPPELRLYIVEMMKKFELAFSSADGDKVFVPDLLTKEEPDTGTWDDGLKFQVKYDILPSSVVSRLTVRMNELISRRTMWRTGVVFAYEGNRALVTADLEDNRISIVVVGRRNTRRSLMTLLRGELRLIHATIPGITAEELVPVPGHETKFVAYDHLLTLEEKGVHTFIPEGTAAAVSVREMLNGLESPDQRQRKRASRSHEEPLPATLGRAHAQRKRRRQQQIVDALILGFFVIGGFAMAVLILGKASEVNGAEIVAITCGALALSSLLGVLTLKALGRMSENGLITAIQTVFDGVWGR